MSRIGKLLIKLPEKVNVSFQDSKVTVTGPKGSLQKAIRFSGRIVSENNEINILSDDTTKEGKALYGLTRSLVSNMVTGVTAGYKRTMKIVGVGYKAQVQGKSLLLNLGYSHPISFPVPEGIKIETPDQNTIVVNGIDRELVGQVSANIRGFREPEPYKGKGIMYTNEVIRRKAGKAGAK
jgi:large subunit ribosomal protein L6